ncbi:MAG TPA: thiamine pyrophosphate-binding protein [Streptosporangiaceae bacterium]|nr:thiamine pyrophosphate-binding protein [Streptosporangiaceae bacterium]
MTEREEPALARFGIRSDAYQRALRTITDGQCDDFFRNLLARPDGSPDGLPLALASDDGGSGLAAAVAAILPIDAQEAAASLSAHLAVTLADLKLTGAEATALVLRKEHVRTVFAYAGTSELALCDSIARTTDLRLVNGRGDSASTFMAAGASLLAPGRGCAVLHGARGLTHATGAIADARRNEVGLLAIVGLPSTRSARFLPPHGEHDLIAGIGQFAKLSDQVGPVPADGPGRALLARHYLDSLRSALRRSRTPPAGPSLIGLPQDVAETTWVPLTTLDVPARHADQPELPTDQIDAAAALVAASSLVLIMIDDYLLRHELARPALVGFAHGAGALVTQARYRRGAMLFERLQPGEVPGFIGWYDPADPRHQALMAKTDLLVTVEDRNLYERVVGPLPPCRKLAITSDAAKVRKNEYLAADDLVIEGDPVAVLRLITDRLDAADRSLPVWNAEVACVARDPALGLSASDPSGQLRAGIAAALAQAFDTATAPVLVDDSQMFGGLVCHGYDQFPAKLRVFGDHCGFVGSGISLATGLAISDPSRQVFCLLGDQAFTNGLQGLVATGQERPPIVFVVCNNGQSVSLLTQAAGHPDWFDGGRHPHLRNPAAFDYAAAARSMGLSAWRVEIALDRGLEGVKQGLAEFSRCLADASGRGGPTLIELILPSADSLWDGIWLDRGFDETATPA